MSDLSAAFVIEYVCLLDPGCETNRYGRRSHSLNCQDKNSERRSRLLAEERAKRAAMFAAPQPVNSRPKS